MQHSQWDQIVPALIGMVGALVIWGLSAIRDAVKFQGEKSDKRKTEQAIVRVAEIGSDSTFRNELWKRINDLEAKVEALVREVHDEQQKAAECEQRYSVLEDKMIALEAQIKGPIGG